MSRLESSGIRFGGAVVSKQMMAAIVHVNDPLSYSAEALASLRRIELAHGAAVLSGRYTKLVRLAQIARKESWSGFQPASGVVFLFTLVGVRPEVRIVGGEGGHL